MLTTFLFLAAISPSMVFTPYRIEPYPGPRLMRNAEVRKEMDISLEAAYVLFNEFPSEFNLVQPYRFPPANSQQQKRAMNAILSRLSDLQRKRLGELYVQIHRESSTLDPTIASRLGLSGNQKERVRAFYNQAEAAYFKEKHQTLKKIYDEAGYRPRKSFGPTYALKTNPVPREVMEKINAARPRLLAFRTTQIRFAEKQTHDILTAQQRKRLEQMRGKPATSDLPAASELNPMQW